MQKGLFSSLPSISNWPARTDLSAASVWAMRNGLAEEGDFLALFEADDGAVLACDGRGIGPNDILSEGHSGLSAALVDTLGQIEARCLVFARPCHSRTVAALSVSQIPPICPDSALFHRKHTIDGDFGGRPLAEEAPRLAAMLTVPEARAVLIGNLGVITLGASVAQALSRLHRFERAADTYLRALATGQGLRLLPDELAVAQPEPDSDAFFAAIKQSASA
ncbi:class II aldolase/adducin family protein [Vannielia litorea]|uniref:class II aldolase/adducin family protein n=1 Tax=Vannielia litorea TaxID=1217970 RepID=UPI001BCF4B2E|nr:class II aldolase/adducin family protein [Vannielia litorea]MBS8227927.1 hypothetical protein [Vannielia litorea]